jgi:putative hydrolase of the HAD superfamily
MDPDRLVLWDFDGTLARRPGLWSGCVLEVLNEHAPEHGVARAQIAAALRDGFPWHSPESPHPELGEPEDWWRPIEALLAKTLAGVGIATSDAAALARATRRRFADGSIGWQIYDDAHVALDLLTADGWRHAVLSNHIPELSEIIEQLGLAHHFDHVHSSARIGFEKPHPEAFRIALAASGNPAVTWMVGDNPRADVAGAEAVGLGAILVHSNAATDLCPATTLEQAAAMIIEASR